MGGQGPPRLNELRNRFSTVEGDGGDQKKINDYDDRCNVPSKRANDTVPMTPTVPTKDEQSMPPVW